MERRKRYVYVVAGLEDASQNFDGVCLIVSEKYGAQSTFKKAQQELKEILNEACTQAAKEDATVKYEMTEDTLDMEFESGVTEYYKIFKMVVN